MPLLVSQCRLRWLLDRSVKNGVFLVIATGLLQTDVVLGCIGQTIGSPEYHSLALQVPAGFGFDCLVRAYRVRVSTGLTVLVEIDETDV